MLPLNKLFADYRANRYGEEILTDWGSALIYRPIGITLAWLLTATRITPNAVTATGALLLPSMLAMAILFQPAAALASVLVLAIVYLVLDCTDGSLARATGHVSVSGHYWDLVTDLAYRGCIYVTVGYLADQISPWSLPVSQMSCMALAAWAQHWHGSPAIILTGLHRLETPIKERRPLLPLILSCRAWTRFSRPSLQWPGLRACFHFSLPGLFSIPSPTSSLPSLKRVRRLKSST